MLSVINNRRYFYKKNMMDYCLKSSEESIQRILDREKNQKSTDVVKIIEKELETPQFKRQMSSHVSGTSILVFLSLYSFIHVFFNRNK